MTSTSTRFESEIDIFSPEHIVNPFPALDELRETSAAVYMTKQAFWLMTRYEDVRAATRDWRSFSSADGVALVPQLNPNHIGSVLGTDPPEHDRLRSVLSEKLAPRALTVLRGDIVAQAEKLVADLVARGRFDAVIDLAYKFPIDVVSDLVGLPKVGRERLQPGADAVFAAFGPPTRYLEDHVSEIEAYFGLILSMTDRTALTPNSWGSFIMDEVDGGRLSDRDAFNTMSAYLVAGMDTTVNSFSALFALLGQRPDIWDAVRADPSLKAPLFEEILRLETPVQGFFRKTTRDVTIGDVHIPAGERVMVHWGAANRDPRHFSDPAEFRLDRGVADHLGFGYGIHACAGQGLARLESAAIIDAFLAKVSRLRLTGPPVRGYNPIVRRLESVPLQVELDAS